MDVLVNAPTHTWVYTRAERIERNGKRTRSITRPASEVSPIQRGAVYLNTKIGKWVTNNFDRNKTYKAKLKLRQWVNPNC
jgi:hypothetical protein